MTPNTQTVGGGPATGLANEFTQWLSQGLATGIFGGPSPGAAVSGANPVAGVQALTQRLTGGAPPKIPGSPTTGPSGIVNDILSGGAGKIGGSLQQILAQQQGTDVANLRSRYSMGGTGTGSPAAFAESLYRSQAAPQAAMQIGQLQLSALLPLLNMIAQLSGRGIPQASTVVGPSDFSQITGGLAGLAEGAGAFGTGAAALKKVA